jgi:hypothetical protein
VRNTFILSNVDAINSSSKKNDGKRSRRNPAALNMQRKI